MPKNVDGFGLVISRLMENTLLHMSNIFLQAFLLLYLKKLVLIVSFWEKFIEITIFNCLTIFHRILPKNDDRFGLGNPKLRKNILFCMSSTLLEAFLKFIMSKQWQWHMENTIEITFLNCLIRFHSLLLENIAGSNWSYQNWENH